MVRNCKSSSRCGRCSGKHHESICRTDENRDHNAKNESQSTIRSNDRKVAEDKCIQNWRDNRKEKDSTVLSTRTKQIHCNSTIMLQTAFVSVTSASKRRVKARVLFDTGAQRTFITRRLTSRLGCESSCKETLSISSFGTDFSDRAQFELVTINLISETGEIGIEALVTPAISPPIKMKFNKEWLKLVDLDGLKLADNLHEDVLDVDILIGNDYYGSLMTGNVMKQNGIMAMECVFG